jgi:hypothetical protein
MAYKDITANAKNVARRDFADIDLFFKAHPVTGDVTVKYDSDAIKRSVRNIVLTNPFERPFKPGLGSNVRSFLFENNTITTRSRVIEAITESIENFEPRVSDVQVQVDDTEGNYLNVTIFYKITNEFNQQRLDVTISRVR